MSAGRRSSTYPNEASCLQMMQEEGCPERVITHCCTVHALAMGIARLCGADEALVSCGALLHDLGRCREMGISHAVVGAEMAEALGLPEEVVEIIRRHIGAGFDEEEVEEMGLPPGDYFPRTLEQKVVAAADNLTSDNRFVPCRFTVEKLISKSRYRGAERVELLHMELSSLCGQDLDDLALSLGMQPELEGPCKDL